MLIQGGDLIMVVNVRGSVIGGVHDGKIRERVDRGEGAEAKAEVVER